MAEWPSFVAEGEKLLGHRLRRAMDHARVDDRFDSHVLVRLLRVRLQTGEPAGTLEHFIEIPEGVAIGALLAQHACARFRVRAGHVHILAHPPIRAVGYPASLAAAIGIERPMRGYRARGRERSRHRLPATNARNLGRRRTRA